MKYVFDTSAVIVLLEICDLKTQLQAFSRRNLLYVPDRVREEFLEGCKIDREAINIFSPVPSIMNQELLVYFNYKTSPGEFWTISYGCTDENCVCVIDEGFGRDLCEFLKIKYTGSIGVINEMKNQGFLSKTDLANIRERIKTSKFYLSKELLKKLDEICS
jgi:predicted nucleic acid-binding protein